jgi:hypothetical protein
MNETTHDLQVVGDALQRSWHADHARRVTGKRSRGRRLGIILVAAAVLVAAGTAIGSSLLKSANDEQQGMLNGYALFKGTHPSCQRLQDSSFTCRLDKPPTEISFYGPDGERLPNAYLGVKAETVNSSRHVDGGCVSTSADGRAWHCYLGEEAVRQGILGPDYLGTYLPEPPTA